jgi:hypothetical protein
MRVGKKLNKLILYPAGYHRRELSEHHSPIKNWRNRQHCQLGWYPFILYHNNYLTFKSLFKILKSFTCKPSSTTTQLSLNNLYYTRLCSGSKKSRTLEA